MPTQSQRNAQEIIKLQGEIKLIHQKLTSIKDNHLAALKKDNKLSELVANPIATRTVSFNTTLVPGPGAPSLIMNLQSIGRTNGIDSIDTDK